uniref:alpha-1,6-mannosyl-glycoprotein 6-beta-N-acetylglucosaminyltransferase n=1 Tax=Wuchereria bancrofti TaxID=6293 RepID=A0AAF5PZW5_WUCBA
MGFLSREAGFKFGQLSSTGGPLGELVQWSDLIAALYLLGHNLMISTEVRTLKKCKLRILDSFGTHAEFNSRIYFAAHKNSLGGSRKNPWGNHQICIRFATVHDDVYGKAGYMWKNAKRLIETVRKFTEVHATVSDNLPDFDNLIINHGVLIGPELHALMRKAKIFLGLGFPFEGPAPLEAIANGVVFINPSFNPPKSRKTSDFFKDKPTLRELTSQNPYAELFIRRPHVFTVNREFIAISILISKQDFCYVSRFPPLHAMITVEAVSMQSCQDACCQHNFLCERSFSRIVNMPEFLNKSGSCATLKSMPIPYECSKQENSDLYSCASVPTILDIRRICPCRDFLQGQTALCSSCL